MVAVAPTCFCTLRDIALVALFCSTWNASGPEPEAPIWVLPVGGVGVGLGVGEGGGVVAPPEFDAL